MSECSFFQTELVDIICGTAKASPPLARHLESCRDCRRLLQTHLRLEEYGPDESDDLELDLYLRRQEVMAELRGRQPRISEDSTRAARKLSQRLRVPVGFAAAIILGFWLGMLKSERSPVPAADSDEFMIPNFIVSRIQQNAESNKVFRDSANSPFSFNNISFTPIDGNRVALRFDLTTHVEVESPRDDPMAKELMIQSMLQTIPMNNRLEAMEAARTVMDPRIKTVLILALRRDQELPVRLKAMTILSEYRDDPEIQAAFLDVLVDEESTQMRLSALDYLIDSRITSAALDQVNDELERRQDTPLLVKLQNARMTREL